jgi:transposase
MDVLVERCAGLDVHRDSVMATVRVPGARRRQRERHSRAFGTTIAQLAALGDWLAGFEVTLVGMEATGIYWQPVFYVLEPRFECWLLNAQHLHNVPGRKSDVIDSAWICELVEHGLVRPSFVPLLEIRRLRELTRPRKAEIQERTRTIQRLEKLLQSVGIKLTSVASQAYSVSARAMLEALLAGVSDPNELAELARGPLRAKIPQLREALANRFDASHHGVLVSQLLAHIDALDQAILTLDERIAPATAPQAELIQLLSTIPGVKRRTAEVLLAEGGTDMSVFPSVGHFASWARICPGNNNRPARTLRQNTPRLPLAPRSPDRGRSGRRADKGHLPRVPLLADPRPSRRTKSNRRHPPRHPRRLLPHRPRPRPLPRTRPRLARPPPLTRTPNTTTRAPARNTRPQSHTRKRLNT